MLPPSHLALGAAIVFLSFVVRGFTGFGAALVAIPLLALFLDFKAVVVVIGLLSIVNGAWLAAQARRDSVTTEVLILLGGFVVGLWVGVEALARYSSSVLKQAFGLFIAATAFRLLLAPLESTGKRWPLAAGWVAGVGSGVAGGVFGAGGPPAVIYLCRRLASRKNLRATILVYFLVADLARLAAYVPAGVITPAVLQASLWFVPASILGSWSGARLQIRVSQHVFRWSICAVLLGTGVLFALGR